MSEFLTSNKLNKSSRNQLFLHSKKPRGRVHMRDPSSRDGNGSIEQNISIYADYRHISTNNADADMGSFQKNVRFPQGLFAAGNMPIVIYSFQYHGDAVHRVLPVVNTANSNRVIIRAETQAGNFSANQDYWANIIAIGPTDITEDQNTFLPVDWGQDDEDLQVSSRAINQMSENTDFLTHNKIMGTLSNVDYVTNDQDYYVRYLNNNLVMYGKYEEFNPLDDVFNKTDDSTNGTPKKFVMNFEFPDNLFARTAHPVVVANVGAKVAANTDMSDAIRKLTCIIKDIRIKTFALEIWEMSNNQEFDIQDTYFVSYVVIGEKPGEAV